MVYFRGFLPRQAKSKKNSILKKVLISNLPHEWRPSHPKTCTHYPFFKQKLSGKESAVVEVGISKQGVAGRK
jgi:hypothetical protein